MKNQFLIFLKSVAAIVATIFIASCNREFDAPPLNPDPEITVTMKIMDLKARYQNIGDFQRIQDDQIISGVIVADDRSGNFYKQVIIQDETGGIPVMLDANNVYTQYPVGRRIYVKLKGLMLGDYGGTIEIGLDSSRSDDGRYLNLDGIPQAMFDQYIVKGSFNNTLTPKVVKPTDFTKKINDPLMSTLVQMQNMEFDAADVGKTYADPSKTASAVNYTISNCNGQNIVLRNSSYARFAALTTPNGNGTITGVANIFNSTMQLFIRDTSDVQFAGQRCEEKPSTPISIADLRKLYTTNLPLNNLYTIGGTVSSSNTDNKNLSTGSFIMQSGNRAILVYAGGTIPYVSGDSVVLKVGFADSLLNYQNSLELKLHFGIVLPTAVATGKKITPEVKTIADINNTLSLPLSDPNNFEFALVRVNSATLTGGTTFSGNKPLTDASGNVTLFTRGTATFANATIPSNTPDWIVYSLNFNATKEVSIRSLDDVIGGVFTPPSSGGGIDLGATSPYLQNFDEIGSGLPTGIKVVVAAKTDTVGSDGNFIATASSASGAASTNWNATGFGFKNFASATGQTASTTITEQASATNRALGVRQTGTAGIDPGSAFVFVINNTIGKSNLKLDFLLQSLDATSATGRTSTWTVDYGLGEDPRTFTTVATSPASLKTSLGPGNFSNIPVHADLPAALNNNASKIWIRVVTLEATTGAGSRPSTAIDDFKISW